MSKRFSKYIDSFDFFDKFSLFYLQQVIEVFFASFATIIEAPVGIGSASCSLAFTLDTNIVKKLLKKKQNKKKKHNKITMLDRSNLNSIKGKYLGH